MRKKKRNMQKEERYVLQFTGGIGGKGRLTSLWILIHNLIQVEREDGGGRKKEGEVEAGYFASRNLDPHHHLHCKKVR